MKKPYRLTFVLSLLSSLFFIPTGHALEHGSGDVLTTITEKAFLEQQDYFGSSTALSMKRSLQMSENIRKDLDEGLYDTDKALHLRALGDLKGALRETIQNLDKNSELNFYEHYFSLKVEKRKCFLKW